MDDHDSLLPRGNTEDPPQAWWPGQTAREVSPDAAAPRTEVWRPEERGDEATAARDAAPRRRADPGAQQHQPPPGYGAQPTQAAPRQDRPTQAYRGQQPTQAYPGQGYPSQGSPGQGYPSQGSPGQGYPPQGNQGYPNQGYPPQGYPNQGYPPQGYGAQNPGYGAQALDDTGYGQPPPGQPGHFGPGNPGQLGPGGPTGYDPGYEGPGRGHNGPKAGTIIVALLAAVAAATIAGVVIGFLQQSPPTTATPGPKSSPSVVAQPSESASPTATSAPETTTTTTAEAVQRIGYVEQPWNRPGMDFGILTGVSRGGDGAVVLGFDRATFLVGTKAQDYFRKHPTQEPGDYALVNSNRKVRHFDLVPDAELYGTYLLGDHQEVRPQDLTGDDLVAKFQAAQAQHEQVLVWLRHRDGADGPVVYLAEQFIP